MDTFGAFNKGMAAGNEANKARAKAAREAYDAEFKRQMNIAEESRLLTGAAEDEWNRLQLLVDADDWDPARAPALLASARRLDATYPQYVSKVGSAEKHFAKALHLTPTDVAVSGFSGGKVKAGKPSPLAGFTDPTQKAEHANKRREQETERQQGIIESTAIDFVQGVATGDDGLLDPNLAKMAMLEFRNELMAGIKESGIDYELAVGALENAFGQLADLMEAQAELRGLSPAELREVYNDMSKDLSSWIKSELFTAEQYGVADIEQQLDPTKKAPMRHLLETMGQRLIRMDLDMPTIKGLLIQTYVGPDGKWQDGTKASPYAAALAKAPVDFMHEAQSRYLKGADPTKVMPYWDPETETGWFIDSVTHDLLEPIYGGFLGSAAMSGPTPAEQRMLDQGAQAAPVKQGGQGGDAPAAPGKVIERRGGLFGYEGVLGEQGPVHRSIKESAGEQRFRESKHGMGDLPAGDINARNWEEVRRDLNWLIEKILGKKQ